MSTEDFVTELYVRVHEQVKEIPKHSQANLYPCEVVTLAILFSLKGVGNRAFYRWILRDLKGAFPLLPERTRLFKLFNTHSYLADRFMADPTVIGVIDTYGIELIHPMREGRSEKQIGKKGISNHRWIVGGKLCLLLNKFGLVVGWDCRTANVSDKTFNHLISQFKERMVVFSDTGFRDKNGVPDNLKICKRGTWNDRMIVETVLSMMTTIFHFKKILHRKWEYFQTRLAFTMATFNTLLDWDGLVSDENGFFPISIARFSL
jgi:hypothetical protein